MVAQRRRGAIGFGVQGSTTKQHMNSGEICADVEHIWSLKTAGLLRTLRVNGKYKGVIGSLSGLFWGQFQGTTVCGVKIS